MKTKMVFSVYRLFPTVFTPTHLYSRELLSIFYFMERYVACSLTVSSFMKRTLERRSYQYQENVHN
jgi:hypothetical protein